MEDGTIRRPHLAVAWTVCLKESPEGDLPHLAGLQSLSRDLTRMKRTLLVASALLALGCQRPAPTGTPSPPSPVSSSPVAAAASETATPEPLGDPALPTDAETFLVPLPAWTLADKDQYPWWTQSGISDNGLRAFVSELEPAEVKERLTPFLNSDERVALPETKGFFDVDDSGLALFAKPDDSYGVAALVSPLAQPPLAWERLGLPPLNWAAQSALMEGKKSVVVIFAGYGTTDYLKNRVASSTPSATATPAATDSPAVDVSPAPTPDS